jgi:CRISPR-associated protein Cas1
MNGVTVPWKVVSGFGKHLKATTSHLIIHYRGEEETVPLHSIRHLLVVGGHTVHTSAVTHLLKSGAWISFFDPNGTPLGVLRPFGSREDETVSALQRQVPAHRYAVEIAQASLKSRLILMETVQDQLNAPLFYAGELEFLHNAYSELEFLIKLDELRRLHKLATDMFYEILSRSISPELAFRRRTERPHNDPVNAMLSLGYALLFGACAVPVFGAHLDPDHGFLHRGNRGLVLDLIDPLKPRMVDEVVFSIARTGLSPDLYDRTTARCLLADELVEHLVASVHGSINEDVINTNIRGLVQSIRDHAEFTVTF